MFYDPQSEKLIIHIAVSFLGVLCWEISIQGVRAVLDIRQIWGMNLHCIFIHDYVDFISDPGFCVGGKQVFLSKWIAYQLAKQPS